MGVADQLVPVAQRASAVPFQVAEAARAEAVATMGKVGDGHSPAYCLAFDPSDGATIAAGCYPGQVARWDARAPHAAVGAPIKAHDITVWCMQYSPCGRVLATGGDDNMVKLWDNATGAGTNLHGYLPSGYTSSSAIAIDKNFAGLLPLWDILFGTYYMPKDRLPQDFGATEPVPTGYFGQLWHPFAGWFKRKGPPPLP